MSKGELYLHYQVITECWKLMKKYHDAKDDDSYWDSLIHEARQLYERYRTEFAKNEIVNILSELERSCRKKES